jgi:tetratricopeptide (TPR) repeat protein
MDGMASIIQRWYLLAAAVLLLPALAPRPAGAIPAWMRGWRDDPYEESADDSHFRLFNRPSKKTPAAQWAYVQSLRNAGKTRAAARQALALRLSWPTSPEAPEAQWTYARLLDERGHPAESFDAFQYMVDHYIGLFDFGELIAVQHRLAKTVMDARVGKFLFLPGFRAPEKAIPLYEKIAENAPEDPRTAEALLNIGKANEFNFEYAKAIDAYFRALNRFPGTPAAEEAALRQALCHIEIADDEPNDQRALATARAACELYLRDHSGSADTADIERMQANLKRLADRQSRFDYDLGLYYEKTLKRPDSAIIAYQTFLERHPGDFRAEEVRQRLAALQAKTQKEPSHD